MVPTTVEAAVAIIIIIATVNTPLRHVSTPLECSTGFITPPLEGELVITIHNTGSIGHTRGFGLFLTGKSIFPISEDA